MKFLANRKHLTSTALCMNYFHRQAILPFDFLLGTGIRGGGRTILIVSISPGVCTQLTHLPWDQASRPHPYSSPFPWPLGRKAVLHDIFEPFLWVSRGHRSKHTLKYSIYWSYNLTLNWKAYFSNFPIILGQLSGAPAYSRHELICQFTNVNLWCIYSFLWLVCCLGHPFFRAGHVFIRSKCGIRENELKFMFEEIFGLSLRKIWCNILSWQHTLPLSPSGSYLAFSTRFLAGMAWSASILLLMRIVAQDEPTEWLQLGQFPSHKAWELGGYHTHMIA